MNNNPFVDISHEMLSGYAIGLMMGYVLPALNSFIYAIVDFIISMIKRRREEAADEE